MTTTSKERFNQAKAILKAANTEYRADHGKQYVSLRAFSITREDEAAIAKVEALADSIKLTAQGRRFIFNNVR